MLPRAEISRDLVLVGGGHAHALALRMLAMRPIRGLRITLVSPDSHTPYSGMLPGLVAGHYSFEESHIDLRRLCQWASVRFIAAPVLALDPQRAELQLPERPPLGYDLLSIDIGSRPELESVPGAQQHSVPVKPVAGLWQRWQALESRLGDAAAATPVTLAVVGGGAGSVELVLAMACRLQGRSVTLELYCGAAEILQGYNARARAAVSAALARWQVTVRIHARVSAVGPAELCLENGERHGFDELFWCTGATAAPWIRASGLATDAGGFLAVSDTLQSLDDKTVFGSGDIAVQVKNPRPKAGVFAVRQGPVLAHNLRAMLLGKALRQHRPQQRFLSLVSLGDRRAVADKGVFSANGRWVWRWKDRIDRKFMTGLQDLPASMPGRHWGRLPEVEETVQPVCGGCGAKVGADALGAALAALATAYPRHCGAVADDAVVVPGTDAGPLLQSVDLLREITADPFLMGRIAANHALSDLYACGAQPVSALATVVLPFAAANIQRRELTQLLAGALHEFARVDCQLNGGHSMQGQELALGFVVNGLPMAPEIGLLAKRGARQGDSLVLCKALGTGTLFAAAMQLATDGRNLSLALQSMIQSNAGAARLALEAGASACTDITGFGLLGHLLEMLEDGQGAKLELGSLPLLAGARDSLAAGIVSTAHDDNAAAAAALVVDDGVDARQMQIVFDPQTSGGLLIAVDAERALQLKSQLRGLGYEATEIIGTVTAAPDGQRVWISE